MAFVVLFLTGLPKAVATEEQIPEPITDAVTDALVAWAGFASTGDLATTDTVFVVSGPQHRQFENEAATWSIYGTSDPLHFTIHELRLSTLGAETATVWATVEASRPGFESQLFTWDFDLLRRDGRWQVWTVLSAERPRARIATGGSGNEPPTVSTTLPEPLRESQPSTFESSVASPSDSESPTQPTRGVRLPALSAWIIVITVVGVALAGYLAPRLDRRAE